MPGDPQAVGQYRLLGRLGAGGMGVVYLGRPGPGAPDAPDLVAIKTLKTAYTDDTEARRRFRAEADFAQRVASFCTAQVIEDGSESSKPYLVTELIEGPPLSDVVAKKGPLPEATLQAVAIGVADALHAIHKAGVAHRDLKPANVLLARSGPRIIDFGIAHELNTEGELTQTGMVMGSPGWIAPERLTGSPATAASDVFSWGLVIAYAAQGRHPFGVGDAGQLAERIMTMPPDLSGVPEPLRDLVSAALDRDPKARPTPERLLSALLAPRGQASAEHVVAELWKPAADPDATGPQRRHNQGRVVSWFAAAGVAVAVLATCAFLVGDGGPGGAGPGDQVTVTASASQGGTRPPQTGAGGGPGGPGGSGSPGGPGVPVVPGGPGPTPGPSGTSGPAPSPGAPQPSSPGSPAPTTTTTAVPTTPVAETTKTKKPKKSKKPKKNDTDTPGPD